MAKEKTEFEIRANTLKAMAKQCTAKVKNNRAALIAVFIDRMSENAYAGDGYKVAILDMYGHMDPAEVNELALYADMQAIVFANGFALISAKKKETFVKNFGNGLADADTKNFEYPNLMKILPQNRTRPTASPNVFTAKESFRFTSLFTRDCLLA